MLPEAIHPPIIPVPSYRQADTAPVPADVEAAYFAWRNRPPAQSADCTGPEAGYRPECLTPGRVGKGGDLYKALVVMPNDPEGDDPTRVLNVLDWCSQAAPYARNLGVRVGPRYSEENARRVLACSPATRKELLADPRFSPGPSADTVIYDPNDKYFLMPLDYRLSDEQVEKPPSPRNLPLKITWENTALGIIATATAVGLGKMYSANRGRVAGRQELERRAAVEQRWAERVARRNAPAAETPMPAAETRSGPVLLNDDYSGERPAPQETPSPQHPATPPTPYPPGDPRQEGRGRKPPGIAGQIGQIENITARIISIIGSHPARTAIPAPPHTDKATGILVDDNPFQRRLKAKEGYYIDALARNPEDETLWNLFRRIGRRRAKVEAAQKRDSST